MLTGALFFSGVHSVAGAQSTLQDAIAQVTARNATAPETPSRPTALAPATKDRPVEIELQSASRVVAPGETVHVAIRLLPDSGWHAYWRHAGDVGSPPSIAWKLPPGFTAAPLRWPRPELISAPPLASYGYEREVHMLGAIHVPSSARVGSKVTFAGTVTWVVCREECFADEVDLALTLPVAAASIADSAASRAIAEEAARVPIKSDDWTFLSAADSTAVVLRIQPPAGSGLTASDLASVHFFVDSAAVIDHAAQAAIGFVGDAILLRVARSQYASGIPTRITGVLTLAGDAILCRFQGEDTGSLTDLALDEMEQWIEKSRAPLRWFLDLRDARTVSPEVSRVWTQWIAVRRDCFARISALSFDPLFPLVLTMARLRSGADFRVHRELEPFRQELAAASSAVAAGL